MVVRGNRFLILVRLGCPILIGHPCKIIGSVCHSRCRRRWCYYLQFRKIAYDYEAELQLAKDKQLPYIELYQELRRNDNYPGHNKDLIERLNQQYGYAKDC